MITIKTAVPAHSFSPARTKMINRLRLNTDICGVVVVRIILPFTLAFPSWLQLVFSIYNIMALVTILTVDPTRFPEAATTRIKQKQAWVMLITSLPLLTACFGIIVWSFHLTLQTIALPSIGVIVSIYMDELLFRNILQPKLRKLGLSKMTSILVQSIFYASSFLTSGLSSGIVVIMFLLGLFNGWMVYKYRSLWPAFALSFVVHLFCVS
jgi:membrane protease YdiL (CAAX protease family)